LHRKLREWHRLGLVACVAWADTICEDMINMQTQSEELGVSVRSQFFFLTRNKCGLQRHRNIMDDLEARAQDEDISDKRDLSLSLIHVVQTEELKRDAMKLRGTAADNFMNLLLRVSLTYVRASIHLYDHDASHLIIHLPPQINWSISRTRICPWPPPFCMQ
jgi:hypothetical protein